MNKKRMDIASSPPPVAGTTPPAGGTTVSPTVKTAAPAATPPKAVTPDPTAEIMGTDIYTLFIGIFAFALSLVVLLTTGSFLAVLVVWMTIALVVVVLVYYRIVDIDKDLGVTKDTETPLSLPSGGPLVGSEVFYVSTQQFVYDEAPAVCAAYGAELATLEQIMDAYAKGAEWCGYGWSAGGMALYPTQRETWEKLQAEVDNGKRTRCGRPGVNGGYFDPSLKFGVNCFGFKPRGDFDPPAPVPGVDTQKFNQMVNNFRNMLKIFTVDPYSRMKWSANPIRNVTESFTVGGLGFENMFTQNFFTPHGVKEGMEVGDPRYVEPIRSTGLGNSAQTAQGPYGLLGDPGPEGPKGPIGPTGPRGLQGERGTGGKGDPGEVGPRGEKGDKGDKGDTGDVTTVVGPKGDPGAPSTVPGPTGPRGATGPASTVAGPKGDPGAPGAAGAAASIPRDLTLSSLRLGNIILDTSRGGGNQLQIRDVNDNSETGFVLDPDWHTSELWSRRNGNDWRYIIGKQGQRAATG